MIPPLRKHSREGEVYVRRRDVEERLLTLASLPLSDLVDRCRIGRQSPDFVPSECLLHFVRSLRDEPDTPPFKELYALLMQRILAKLPPSDGPDGQSSTQSAIREGVVDRIVEWLAADRLEYQEALDFYEVQFESAFAKLRLTVQRPSWREEKRRSALEGHGESGTVSAEVEEAALGMSESSSSFDDFRSGLDEAIGELPLLQARIIGMLREDIPIDSQDPAQVTIARTLQRSERTIRTQRDLAIAALRAKLSPGEDHE